MPAMYLTPASLSYLNQCLLALLITAYLGWRLLRPKQQPTSGTDRLLACFFVMVTLLSLGLFLEASLLPTERLMVVYLLNTILAVLLVVLLQFACVFPQPSGKRPLERWLALIVSGSYAVWEAGIAVWRFDLLLREARVVYRPPELDYVPAALFAWAVFVFARGTAQNWRNPAMRRFALIFLIPLALTLLNVLRSYAHISDTAYHISVSVGILIAIFLFALNYLASQPEATTLMVKISGAVLTGVLSVFGVVSWLVTPAYAAQYRPAIIDERSIRFMPNSAGGYDVMEMPFSFERERGRKLALADETALASSYQEVAFDMPFYSQRYARLFVVNDGMVTFGEPVEYWGLEYHFSRIPAFFALMLDLNPEANPDGGVYLREETDRLIVTYDRIRAFYHPEKEYTFQIMLHSDGRIDLTYHGLPSGTQYYVNDRPNASVWAIGAKPGLASGQTVSFAQLPLRSGPEGVLDDQYRAFRQYLHDFLTPLAVAILGSSALFLFGLPFLMIVAIARPLQTLVRGMEQFDRDQRHRHIPVQFNDEIGFLTRSFNTLTGTLDDIIQNLEARVADRTADLLAANAELHKLSIAVEQSPSVIIITNPQGDIEYVNPAFTLSTGYTFEEVKGCNPRFLQSGQTSPETFKELWAALLAGDIWRGELANRRKNGEVYWEYTVIAPIQDKAGNVTHYVAIKEDITARKAAEEQLARLAVTEPLTGLLNRRGFFLEAEKIYARSLHPPYELAVLMIDIDHFKAVNDRHGHQAGDAVLREIAARIRDSLRPTDLAARYGGEEFVVLLPRTARATLVQITNRLLAAVREQPVIYDGLAIAVTISIGAAVLTSESRSLDELLGHADKAVYQAKQRGRNCCVIWQE